jgi:ribonuclease J
MNCAVLECNGSLLIVDCGVNFPNSDAFGVDLILPDLQWLEERVEDIEALVITHGHQDHLGGVPWLLDLIDIPVWAPTFAARIIEAALAERGLLEESQVHRYDGQKPLQLGPFTLDFARVNHSIPDTFAMRVRAGGRTLVHSADFKFDLTPVGEGPAELDRLASWGADGVDVLLLDSTNALRAGSSGSESQVAARMKELCTSLRGRIVVTVFGTSIFRILGMLEAARSSGRRLLVLGRSLQKHVQIARKLGIIPSSLQSVFIELEQVKGMARDELLVACTGSQGQTEAALPRILAGRFAPLVLDEGDHLIFSARVIPGCEPATNAIKDDAVRRGVRVIDDPSVHVSGHACQDELRWMMQLIRPRVLIPVHGDVRFQHRNAELGAECGIPWRTVLQNGEVVEFGDNGEPVRRAILPFRRMLVAGTPLGEEGGEAMRTRQALAQRGLVVVGLPWPGNRLLRPEDIQVMGRGVWEETLLPDLDPVEALQVLVSEEINELAAGRTGLTREKVQDAVIGMVRRWCRGELRRRPFVEALVVGEPG